MIRDTSQVEDYEGHVGIFKIAGNKTFKSFLPRSIPELKANNFAPSRNIFAYEVDTDGWLTTMNNTFLVGSNSFRIYLAMIELFPTF